MTNEIPKVVTWDDPVRWCHYTWSSATTDDVITHYNIISHKAYNNSRMAICKFMKFGMDIKPWEGVPTSHASITYSQ